MNWTKDQQSVIDARGSNLLVSAAAGSGKTAVLVARIIERVTDKDAPMSLERLLVLTFTRAAAQEMRERIGKALNERLLADPDDRFLQLQKAILPRAKITTIDSYCQSLIRERYQALGIDPNFSVADEGDLKLMKADVMDELLEEQYETGAETFLRFASAYSGTRLDTKLSALIEQLYTFVQAAPWPERYLNAQEESCRLEEAGEPDSCAWMQTLLEQIRADAAEQLERLAPAAEICEEEQGPLPYLDAVKALSRTAGALSEAADYASLYEILSAFSSPRLGVVRGKKYDPDKKDAVKAVIDAARSAFGDAKKRYAALTPPLLHASMAGSAGAVREIIRLTRLYMARLDAAKREKNIVDFSDMEHFAIALLYDHIAADDPREPDYSALADHLAGQFDEILVDEYQDSNELQEALLRALSSERFGRPNLFMVGDVKQSIYQFRLARPQLFMQKYETYSDAEGSANRKIELSQNFRSRTEVLSAVNDVFYDVMQRSVGGVQYDARAALRLGAAYPAHAGCKTECDLIELSAVGSDALREQQEAEKQQGIVGAHPEGDAAEGQNKLSTKEEYEAGFIAQRIRELVRPDVPEEAFQVTDKETGQLRPARYGDIVILMRSTSRRVEKVVDVLGASGIPAYAESDTGYFSAIEVEVMLACLNTIDNPHQDIPLAALMRSPIGGFSDTELAKLRASFWKAMESAEGGCGSADAAFEESESEPDSTDVRTDATADAGIVGGPNAVASADAGAAGGLNAVSALRDLFDALKWAAGQTGMEAKQPGLSQEMAAHCKRFLDWLMRYRELSDVLPVYELLNRIYQDTGYYDIVSAMPLGTMRKKNLDMLLQKAEAYAETSYRGLFHFVRYIEQLKQYNTDYGEAKAVSEQGDLVRITSIHKSKGLEYPIVILAGMGRMFNQQDLRETVVMDNELGIGADYIDLEHRVRYPGLKKAVIREKRRRENAGEELRILYVAMTRAKEKLILTAAIENAADKLKKYAEAGMRERAEGHGLSQSSILGARCYLDWLLLSGAGGAGSIEFRLIDAVQIEDRNASEEADERRRYEALKAIDAREVYDVDFERELKRALRARYPHEAETKLAPKVSVSQLKQAQHAMDVPEDGIWHEAPMDVPEDGIWTETPTEVSEGESGERAVPAAEGAGVPFLVADAGFSGARAGTAFHRAMELLDFQQVRDLCAEKHSKAETVETAKTAERAETAETIETKKEPERGAVPVHELQSEKTEERVSMRWPAASALLSHEDAKALTEKEIARMRSEKRLPEEEAERLDKQELTRFLETPLAIRMAEAAERQALWREQHFMVGIPANQLNKDAGSAELQIVQGIIDAYFEEPDGSIVLVDYKTDRVKDASVLKARYALQLRLYAKALEQLLDQPIRECLIYSARLGQTVTVD